MLYNFFQSNQGFFGVSPTSVPSPPVIISVRSSLFSEKNTFLSTARHTYRTTNIIVGSLCLKTNVLLSSGSCWFLQLCCLCSPSVFTEITRSSQTLPAKCSAVKSQAIPWTFITPYQTRNLSVLKIIPLLWETLRRILLPREFPHWKITEIPCPKYPARAFQTKTNWPTTF